MIRMKNLLIVLALVLIALASATRVTNWATDIETHSHSIIELDKKITTVLELTAAATAASATISLLPDDQCTPIAEQIAELGKYFLLVLSALYLEKYLVVITGYLTFPILVPLACLIWGWGYFTKKDNLKAISYKIAICAAAVFIVIPTSVKVSDLIYERYEESIEITLKNTDEMDEGISESSQTIAGWISDKAEGIVSYVADLLSNFIESLAVMIVTSCLIPILVVVFFVWMIKIMFAVDVTYKVPIFSAFSQIETDKKD